MNLGLEAIKRGLLIDDWIPLDEQFPELADATTLEIHTFIDWNLKLLRRMQLRFYNEQHKHEYLKWHILYEKIIKKNYLLIKHYDK